jgi:hypothetical protein
MAAGGKRAGGSEEKPIRPLLLAGVLGLVWFVVVQEGGFEDDIPGWGMPILLGARLLADFVGGWVVVSLLQLLFNLGRLALLRLRVRP